MNKKQKTISLLLISLVLSMIGTLWGVYINNLIVFFGFIHLLVLTLIIGLIVDAHHKLEDLIKNGN